MKIWIDLANAPHVAFFLPIIRTLTSLGHKVRITLRDFNNTVEIAEEHGINGHVVGKHGGRNDLGKLLNLAIRSLQLARLGFFWKPNIAVSHNSYTHTIAGRLVGSRVITIMDYEGQPANHIAFRMANKVVVPDCFPKNALRRFGAKLRKVYTYAGFKEQLYLSDYRPETGFAVSFREACELPETWNIEDNVVVTVRTPATMAAYHHFKNDLFGILLEYLNRRSDLTVVVLPRNAEQRQYVKRMFPHLKVPKASLVGADLVYHSDVVISAGGTMNREAAILGTPAYTIFGGELPAVDQKLIELGRLKMIHCADDLVKIRFEKSADRKILKRAGLCQEIVAQLLSDSRGKYRKYKPQQGRVAVSNVAASHVRLFRTYYAIKKYIPRRVQVGVRRFVAVEKRNRHRGRWPVDEAAGRKPSCFHGWPGGRQFALALRHDVESTFGIQHIGVLEQLESRLGYRSAYYMVPKAYNVSPKLLKELKDRGNEVGVHGWNHDGKLYISRSVFEQRAQRINKVIEQWQAVGFASPSAHHNFEWVHDLNIQYDTSSFDTDPFEPQPDGVGSIFPLVIRRNSDTYVELPYTLPQDFTLFVILREKNNNIWKDKLDWIVGKGGMAFVNTHPDYMYFEHGDSTKYRYDVELYRDFLEYIRSKYEGLYWHALPREVATFWREEVCSAEVGGARSGCQENRVSPRCIFRPG